MSILSKSAKSFTYCCLAAFISPLSIAHSEVYKTSTGQCIVTSGQYMEGSYRDPNTGKFWKYAPCNSSDAKEQSTSKTDSNDKARKPNTPREGKLKGAFKDILSSIRDKLETCLPFTAGSCSRAPDTIPVTWLPKPKPNEIPIGGVAWRPVADEHSGKMELNADTPNLFPKMVKRDQNGSAYIEFDKLAKVCQAFQNDPRFVTAKGELARQPVRNSILTSYAAYGQLSQICHELIHMGECASCKSPISSEKEAYAFEERAARSAAKYAPKETKALFVGYAKDRAAFVSYMTCRQSSDNATCVQHCTQAGHSAERCDMAGKVYSTFDNRLIGTQHENEKPFNTGTLTSNDMYTPTESGGNDEPSATNNGTTQGSSSGSGTEPTAAMTKFSLSNGTTFACPAGNVGFRVFGSDNIERGYCCPAGSRTIAVGANLDGTCM